jgi:carboxypeptidase Taq
MICSRFKAVFVLTLSTVSSLTPPTSRVCVKTMTSATASTVAEKVETTSKAYVDLVSKLKTITNLQRAKAVLEYDQLVFMPSADATSADRGAQLAALAGLIHEKSTDQSIIDLIEQAEKDYQGEHYPDESRLLEIEKKSFLENQRVPASLAAKSAELSSKAYSAWVKSKTNNDFASFAPILADCFATAKEIATAKRGDTDIPVFNQMLDQFESGMSKERMDEIFGEVQASLVPLISKVLASPDAPSTKSLEGSFPIKKQKELSQKIVQAMGFNKDFGRIDVSVHPMTMAVSPSDVRITSRFREDEWYQGLAGTIHEGM